MQGNVFQAKIHVLLGILEHKYRAHLMYLPSPRPDVYMYRLSLREIMKAAWQMKFDVVAAIGKHDMYPIPHDNITEYLRQVCDNKDTLHIIG